MLYLRKLLKIIFKPFFEVRPGDAVSYLERGKEHSACGQYELIGKNIHVFQSDWRFGSKRIIVNKEEINPRNIIYFLFRGTSLEKIVTV